MLDRLSSFIAMTQKLRTVERMVFFAWSDRQENDLEHSCQLSMFAWLVMDYMKLPLDKERVLKYALVHDIVEVYAGDTNPWDPAMVQTKKDREHASFLKLKEEFGDSTDMFDTIHAYEEKADDEAKFVYALDKLIPEFNILLDNGRSYKHFHVTRDYLVTHMHKSYIYEPLRALIDAIIAELYKRDELFE